MSDVNDSDSKRGRGRPRKNVHNSANLAEYLYTEENIEMCLKRKQAIENFDAGIDTSGYESELTSLNKKVKCDESAQPTRSQPHRAARYTESYSRTSSPDLVQVSDDDENKLNGECNGYDSESSCESIPLPPVHEMTEEEILDMECKLQSLRITLLNEEMKLLLLQKLKQSQILKEPASESNARPLLQSSQRCVAPINKNNTVGMTPVSPTKQLAPANKRTVQRQQIKVQDKDEVIPKKEVQVVSKKDVQTVAKKDAQTLAKKEVQIIQKKDVQIISKVSHSGPMQSTTPPQKSGKPSIPSRPTVAMPPTLRHSVSPQIHVSSKNISTSGQNQVTVSLVPSTPSPRPSSLQDKIDSHAAAQRQAAAKLALRKQLEKTLLQIPPPKPPPPELNFLPNGNSPEFVWLLGLDIVVDFIVKKEAVIPRKVPYTCMQCSTDFTTMWKWTKNDKKGKKESRVICETCVTSNTRKHVKAEHTNRLKMAFVKALQQEQEIDRLAKVPSSLSVTLVPSHSPSSNGNTPTSRQSSNTSSRIRSPSASAFHNNSAALMQQFSKLSPQQQSLLQAQAQSMLAQGIPLPAHMLPFSSLVPQYPCQMLGKTSVSRTDMQRQYLLDMIPSCSLPQNSVNWKT